VSFCFYPQHEYGCPHVRHCPHLGGAALGTLVLMAEENKGFRDAVHRQLDAERERGNRLYQENALLKQQLEQAKLELKLERQTRFATHQQQKPADARSATTRPFENDAKTKPREIEIKRVRTIL